MPTHIVVGSRGARGGGYRPLPAADEAAQVASRRTLPSTRAAHSPALTLSRPYLRVMR